MLKCIFTGLRVEYSWKVGGILPTHRSAVKRVRTSQEERTRNRAWRSQVRGVMKSLTSEKDKSKAQEQLKVVSSVLDKAARKGAIHHKAASRTKSRLARQVNDLPGPKAE
jgi:small subunit ribosomal protein S20